MRNYFSLFHSFEANADSFSTQHNNSIVVDFLLFIVIPAPIDDAMTISLWMRKGKFFVRLCLCEVKRMIIEWKRSMKTMRRPDMALPSLFVYRCDRESQQVHDTQCSMEKGSVIWRDEHFQLKKKELRKNVLWMNFTDVLSFGRQSEKSSSKNISLIFNISSRQLKQSLK